ncbi:hypothetical protein [Spirosoma flavum]|uniref:Uncharacterized protein n=1 Tax=Spirosoma flavum TaxID=2048557 RepID=A0ABW6AVK0_9BACT
MRFIAVYNQLQTSTAVGFDSLIDALDFLFWGYEDNDLTPQGIYDVLTDESMPYDHSGQSITIQTSLDSIRSIAKAYLKNTYRFTGLSYPGAA